MKFSTSLRSKSVPRYIALAGSLLIAGYAFRTDDPLASVTSPRSYHIDNFGSIELQGACSVTPDTVSCWDPDGKAAPELTEKVKAYYLVQSGTDIRYRYGRKNRMVVFKRPAQGYAYGIYMNNATTPSGGYLNTAGQIGQNGNGAEPYLEWYALDSSLSDTTAAIAFNVSVTLGTGKVPLQVGGEGHIGGMTVHIDSINPGPYRNPWNGTANAKQKMWSVSITVSGFPGLTVPNMGGRVIGSDGVEIARVDAAGNPKVDESHRNSMRVGMVAPTGFDAGIQFNAGSGTAHQELLIPVKPAKASALSLTASGFRKITITDILLDPK